VANGEFMRKILRYFAGLSAVYVCILSNVDRARAETRVEQVVSMSQLAKSAMECSQLTRKEEEAKRLFTIAMTAGDKFLSLFESLSDDEREQVELKMDFMWWFAYNEPGNHDFRLGRLWSSIKFDRDLDFNREDEERHRKPDNDKRKVQQELMYANKNCSFIR
jgi:hypothetical protein